MKNIIVVALTTSWKIPPAKSLIARREEVSTSEWSLDANDTVGFTEGVKSSKFVPAEISTPVAILKGHKSIVNTTVVHPNLPLIFTAGIEKSITLHSPFPSSPFTRQLSPTPQEVRQLPESEDLKESQVVDSLLLGQDPQYTDDPDEVEKDTIRLFDRFLRMEGEADPFKVRIRPTDDDRDDEMEEEVIGDR
ncbi:hypothetical protein D9757_007047 [Collybiopsis confluens]|uniref:Uncharacterized protein n=1 Tax=Collybiopsis confluens TaxID=2823264 RepID=A0A8H5HCF9_9AGAR|nr:hypothetical protein D9757_007047 [Collybiopsis confluens]